MLQDGDDAVSSIKQLVETLRKGLHKNDLLNISNHLLQLNQIIQKSKE